MTWRRPSAERPHLVPVQRRQLLQLVAERRQSITHPRRPTVRRGVQGSICRLRGQKRIVRRSANELEVRVLQLGSSMQSAPGSTASGRREYGRAASGHARRTRPTQRPGLLAHNREIHDQPAGTVLLKEFSTVVSDERLRSIDPPILAVRRKVDERIRSTALRIRHVECFTNRLPRPSGIIRSDNRQHRTPYWWSETARSVDPNQCRAASQQSTRRRVRVVPSRLLPRDRQSEPPVRFVGSERRRPFVDRKLPDPAPATQRRLREAAQEWTTFERVSGDWTVL